MYNFTAKQTEKKQQQKNVTLPTYSFKVVIYYLLVISKIV